MSSFFDQFSDLDRLKARAEELWQDVTVESRRQRDLALLKTRLFNLERRMNQEFKQLGETVWELYSNDSLSTAALAGAFDTLEALASEIAQAEADIDALQQGDEQDGGVLDNEPAGDDDAVDQSEPELDPHGSQPGPAPERRIEREPSSSDGPPLE